MAKFDRETLAVAVENALQEYPDQEGYQVLIMPEAYPWKYKEARYVAVQPDLRPRDSEKAAEIVVKDMLDALRKANAIAHLEWTLDDEKLVIWGFPNA